MEQLGSVKSVLRQAVLACFRKNDVGVYRKKQKLDIDKKCQSQEDSPVLP